jgi:hypothetical protein
LSENRIALEIVKIYHENYIYRHTNFWTIVYKSIFAIVVLLSIPYFINDKINYKILYLFPLLSIIICFFTLILLDSEAIRMELIKRKMEDLLKNSITSTHVNYLPERIVEYFESYRKIKEKNDKKNRKQTIWENWIKESIPKKLKILYVILIAVSMIMIVVIYLEKFFIP